MKFCVIRHADVEALGTCPETALEHHRDNGWFRVSQWRDEHTAFHLADFADATEDLDASEPTETGAPETPQDELTPARTTKKEKQA